MPNTHGSAVALAIAQHDGLETCCIQHMNYFTDTYYTLSGPPNSSALANALHAKVNQCPALPLGMAQHHGLITCCNDHMHCFTDIYYTASRFQRSCQSTPCLRHQA